MKGLPKGLGDDIKVTNYNKLLYRSVLTLWLTTVKTIDNNNNKNNNNKY